MGTHHRRSAEPILSYAEYAIKAREGRLSNCGLTDAAREVEAHIFGKRAQQSDCVRSAMQQIGERLKAKNPLKFAFYRVYCLIMASCQAPKP